MSFTSTTTFTVVTCYKCHVQFGMNADHQRRRLNDGEAFWCPNGHRQSYCESKVQKLEKKLARTESELDGSRVMCAHERDRKEKAQRSANAHKGHATKLKNRIITGKCPCCNQHFKNLEEHIESKHPSWVED